MVVVVQGRNEIMVVLVVTQRRGDIYIIEMVMMKKKRMRKRTRKGEREREREREGDTL